MKKIFFILLILSISPAHADEVFKCQLKSGKIVYQSLPCESAEKQKAIEIQKTDPRKIAEEEAKLKAWKEDFAAREAARIKAEKELQAEQDRKASVEALRKSAEYQQRQAYEEKRQTEALKRQNLENPYPQYSYPQYPYAVPPYYPAYQPVPAYPPVVPHHQHKERTATETRQPEEQTGIKLDKDNNTDDSRKKFTFK